MPRFPAVWLMILWLQPIRMYQTVRTQPMVSLCHQASLASCAADANATQHTRRSRPATWIRPSRDPRSRRLRSCASSGAAPSSGPPDDDDGAGGDKKRRPADHRFSWQLEPERHFVWCDMCGAPNAPNTSSKPSHRHRSRSHAMSHFSIAPRNNLFDACAAVCACVYVSSRHRLPRVQPLQWTRESPH